MRTFITAAATALALAVAIPADVIAEDAASLEVTITGLETDAGTVEIGLYADKDAYDVDRAGQSLSLSITGGIASGAFNGLAPGDYGLKVYHDANGNGELDTTSFGMPIEAYGFSNDARGRFGPARWNKAAFSVTAGANRHAITVK